MPTLFVDGTIMVRIIATMVGLGSGCGGGGSIEPVEPPPLATGMHHLWTIPYRAGRVAVTVATGPEEVYDTP